VAFIFFSFINKIKAVNELQNRDEIVQNWLGKFGAFLAHILIYKGFG
jgi:S-DNA-T family DNA segregation ATPase FtsK/SpoIIIE